MDEIETRTWRSGIAVRADPEHVLDALTEVEACEAWSPVGFRVDGSTPSRLRAGTMTSVSGRLAGCRVRFRVDVLEASAERLVLRAAGPVHLSASYVVRPSAGGSRVEAAISVCPGRGAGAAIAAGATSALLTAGALDRTLARIACEAEQRHVRRRRRSEPGSVSPCRSCRRPE
jgi:hypothetical protein